MSGFTIHLSNLPPGCTDSEIERRFGTPVGAECADCGEWASDVYEHNDETVCRACLSERLERKELES
jgi:hypothetical protein